MHLLESGKCLKTNPLLCQQRALPRGLTLALSAAPNILVVLETKRREGRRKSSGINRLNLYNIHKTNSKMQKASLERPRKIQNHFEVLLWDHFSCIMFESSVFIHTHIYKFCFVLLKYLSNFQYKTLPYTYFCKCVEKNPRICLVLLTVIFQTGIRIILTFPALCIF